jgi:hypothetical protein
MTMDPSIPLRHDSLHEMAHQVFRAGNLTASADAIGH